MTDEGIHTTIIDRIMPTRLGNILRFYEDRAGDRFGIDAISVVPYLYSVADNKQVALLSDARLGLDITVRMVWVWLSSFVFSLAAFYDDGPWLAVPVVCYALAWFSYTSTLRSAESYGMALVRMVDLYRFDLLAQLHWPLPERPRDEARNNQMLLSVLDGNHRPPQGHVMYSHD